MSNIDKRALRASARSASAGEWINETSDGWGAICSSDDQANGGFIIAHFVGPDGQANREFVKAANPAAVLTLLDELEAKDKQIADLKEAFSIGLSAAGIDVPAAASKGE
ncbi:ead/Ea22-like family protein [Enterobacter sp. KB-280D8]|uniref:ead/Ea22-like family protein n=1 Tax=Enterobacter sp. KB-280D8 TaxID=3242495 RepID=UPI003528C7DF